MTLDQIRRKIDETDLELLALLEERMELGLRSRRYKTSTTDPRREQAVLNRAMRSTLALVEATFAERLFGDIVSESKRLQESGHRLVAFQGDHGAYSEVAARGLAEEAAYLPCREFAEVLRGVAEGHYDLGVVPVENSLEGSVTQVNDLLTRTSLKIVGEARVPIRHCLLVQDETSLDEIRIVYSHPQALAQCRAFLSGREFEARPYYDTAGAARMLAREKPRGAAVIASSLAAELYGLRVMEEGIEDDRSNSTRFVTLAREAAPTGDKCSVVFVTPHEAGSLYRVLTLFAEAGVNLTRIASMPFRADPANYSFFVDFEGSDRESKVKELLRAVEEVTLSFSFLGCYPRARPILLSQEAHR